MANFIEPIAVLVKELSRLPGIGPKSAQRLAYFLLGQEDERVKSLADALLSAKEKVHCCSICGTLTDADTCDICRDVKRDESLLCVVKDPRDVLAMERAREYKGRYHVLHGVISPMSGVGPDQLRIRELIARIGGGGIVEVIIATNPDIEGDVTATYLAQLLKPLGVRVTRIAHGVPVGSDLEYTDEITLSKALEGRREM